ncbi:unnamed protein product [Periconia digitata]|uniref:Extracellular membrane protein CFEM domain-containing protein n=1 Tax=Periconia digitata TaxID=1303443 RepID=A0A9W4U340_9PLEO|nr:unnamed protein product [Periconia digitata]
MPSLYRLTAVAVQLIALAAAASTYGSKDEPDYDWVKDSLPSCFEDCLGKTSDGCHSQECICSASQSDDYLQSAVECVRDECEKEGLEINVALLVPAQLYCSAVGSSIPDDSVKNAYECAMGGNVPSATHKSATSTAKQHSESELKSTVTSTFSMTTTDGKGHTLQIVQPVAVGPSTVSTGDAVTSTLGSSSSSSASKSASSSSPSTTAAPNQPAQVSSAAPTQAPVSTSSPTQRVEDGGGSPFVNMQASAVHWSFSGPVAALGVVAGLFMRL